MSAAAPLEFEPAPAEASGAPITEWPAPLPFDAAKLPPVRPRVLSAQDLLMERDRAEREHAELMATIATARSACEKRDGSGSARVYVAPSSACLEALERLPAVERALRAGDAAGALEAMRKAAEPIGGRRRSAPRLNLGSPDHFAESVRKALSLHLGQREPSGDDIREAMMFYRYVSAEFARLAHEADAKEEACRRAAHAFRARAAAWLRGQR